MRFFLHLLIASLVSDALVLAGEVTFSREVLPLLSDRCFQCHGPDEANREAGLRLDVPDIVNRTGDALSIIQAGDPSASLLWERITSSDPDLVMPPPDSQRAALSLEESNTIKAWIEQGAEWGKHWSFEPIAAVSRAGDHTVSIDFFIDQRAKQMGLEMNPIAQPSQRLRRLSFALRGVGPTEAEVRSFLEQEPGSRWSRVVDEYLESSLHAERLAMWWLDAARYSDSDGYQQDKTRQNWPWRDWVIDSFSKNVPFDQFTIEQFAGDLLADATSEQILATCFHRNHMTNGEGGRDPAESRVDYVLDRTNTMGTVWLGLTLGCTQCHSHKFDPISQHDYYALTSFFNSIDENGVAGPGAKPHLAYESPYVDSRIEKMESFVAECRSEESKSKEIAIKRFQQWLQQEQKRSAEQYRPWIVPKVLSVTSQEGTEFIVEEGQVVQTTGHVANQDDYRVELEIPIGLNRVTGWKIEVFPHEDHANGMFTRNGNGDFILTNVKTLIRQRGNPSELELENLSARADYQAKKDRKTEWDTRYSNIKETLNDDARDGWTTQGAEEVTPHVGVYRLEEPYSFASGDRFVVVLKHRSTLGDANIGRFRLSLSSELGETVDRVDGESPLQALYSLDEEERQNPSAEIIGRLRDQFLLDQENYQLVKAKLALAQRQLDSLRGQGKARSVMVLQDRDKPRDTNILIRGVWNKKGEVVQPGFLSSIYTSDDAAPKNRLDLAKWIVSEKNPLTPRVVVNHLWQLMFGRGLVATPEDFGLQGERPSHPELLDWLATELIENDWNLRHILRLIANSRAFQRSSVLNQQLQEVDPLNRGYARGPRFRLDSWMLRDNALRIAGLLDEEMGGPPVYPYQPTGIWSEITMGRFRYEPSLGPEQYRRTVYAFWRRSSSPAFLFDSAQRRVCEVRTNRTNTPLQALTLMNDETYLECSRVIADRLVRASDFRAALDSLALSAVSRPWTESEIGAIERVYNQAKNYYTEHVEDAASFTSVGQQGTVSRDLLPETAAWMTCVNMVLNLDEVITFE